MTVKERAYGNGRDLDKILAVASHNMDVRDGRAAGPMIRFHPHIEGVTMSDHAYHSDQLTQFVDLYEMWVNGNRIDVVDRLLYATEQSPAHGLALTVHLCDRLADSSRVTLIRLLNNRQE